MLKIVNIFLLLEHQICVSYVLITAASTQSAQRTTASPPPKTLDAPTPMPRLSATTSPRIVEAPTITQQKTTPYYTNETNVTPHPKEPNSQYTNVIIGFTVPLVVILGIAGIFSYKFMKKIEMEDDEQLKPLDFGYGGNLSGILPDVEE